MSETFSNNSAKSRYELDVGGQVAWADYRIQDKTLFIDHVEAPQSLRGTGAAGRLMKHVAETAAQEGYSITPICGYAAAWLAKNGK
jgi:predicted GNAT family acetyltransferase